MHTISNALAGKRAILLRVAAFLGLLVLAFIYQPYYPIAWLDEATVMNGAATLSRTGQYALTSSEGLRVLDVPQLGNGPGVALPTALVYKLFGTGLLQARLLASVFFVICTVMVFMLARRMYGEPAAWITTLLLIAVPREGYVFYGRQILGHIPAMIYFLAGCLLWMKAKQRDVLWKNLLAGLFFGLSVLTKSQYMLLVPAALLAAAIQWLRFRQFQWKHDLLPFGVMIVIFLGWQGVQYAIMGPELYATRVAELGYATKASLMVFHPRLMLSSIWYLMRAGVLWLVAPGFLYMAWRSYRDGETARQNLLLLSFSAGWLAWYVIGSVGWHRYSFEGFTFGMWFTGPLVVQVSGWLRHHSKLPSLPKAPPVAVRGVLAALLAVITLHGVVGFGVQVKAFFSPADTCLVDFGAYLNSNIPSDTVIETFEWELDMVAQQEIHHPADSWVQVYSLLAQPGREVDIQPYSISDVQPDYVVLGPMGRGTGIYTPYIENHCLNLVYENGPYSLYAVDEDALENQP